MVDVSDPSLSIFNCFRMNLQGNIQLGGPEFHSFDPDSYKDPEPKKDLPSNNSHQSMNNYLTTDEQPAPPAPTGCCGFCSFEYYQPYFNVTQQTVMTRVVRSVSPWKQDFFESADRNPDLYGPFWILTTIIFLLSLMGNVSTYLKNFHEAEFEFRLELVRYGTIIVYSFGLGFPIGLSFLLKFFKSSVTAFQVICLYGYSLSVFLPILALCAIPLSFLQWILMIYGIFNSSAFLILNMNHEISALVPGKKYLVYALMAACQIALFLTFKLVFFSMVFDSGANADDGS